MAANILNSSAAKKAGISLVEDADRGVYAVHEVVVAMQANRRTGSACTKTRSEVSGTGKKPFRQKGTGRARQGGNNPPHHPGGGVAFGPRPRSYSKKVNRTTRRLAFAKALTARIEEGSVITLPTLDVTDGKTRTFVQQLLEVAGEARRVLVVATGFTEETKRAARNYQAALLMSADEVNTEQLLHYSKIVVLDDALPILAARTGSGRVSK